MIKHTLDFWASVAPPPTALTCNECIILCSIWSIIRNSFINYTSVIFYSTTIWISAKHVWKNETVTFKACTVKEGWVSSAGNKRNADIMMWTSGGSVCFRSATLIIWGDLNECNHNKTFTQTAPESLFNGFWRNLISSLSFEIVLPSALCYLCFSLHDRVTTSAPLLEPIYVRCWSPVGLHSSDSRWKWSLNVKCFCCIVLICWRGWGIMGFNPHQEKEVPASK